MHSLLQGLKYELNALAAFCAMNNPVLMHQKWGVSPEGAPQAPLDTPLPEDLHKSSMHLLVRAKFHHCPLKHCSYAVKDNTYVNDALDVP